MLIRLLKSKIHKARVTKKELNYQGSIGVDKNLLDAAGILPGEIVQVLNLNNGERFETYCIEEKEDSGVIVFYGPAARRGEIDDTIIIIAYGLTEPVEAKKFNAKIVHVDKDNRIIKCSKS